MKFTPQQQQVDATRELVVELSASDRATAVMACGTGKSLIGPMVCESLFAKSVIIFVPSLFLMKQSITTWRDQGKLSGGVAAICVCSEDMSAEGDDVSIEDADLGLQTTTNPDDVRVFLESTKHLALKIVFATYQSAKMIGLALDGLVVSGERYGFDLGVFDEAHRTCGEKGSLFTYALDDTNILISKRVFLTATPKIVKSRSDSKEVGILAMNNYSTYGRHVYVLSFAQAAERNIIVPYKILITVIDSIDIDAKDISIGVVQGEDRFHSAKSVAGMRALTDAMRMYGLNKAISFHSDTVEAFDFSLVELDKSLKNFHVNGRQKASLRNAMMDGFKKFPRSLITNARCLTEGVDIPAVDVVAFMSPKSSVVDIVQAAGRAMRKSQGKTHGYILLPLYVDTRSGETPDVALERSNFSQIYMVLNSLKENDEALQSQVRSAGIQLGHRGERSLSDGLFGDMLNVLALNGSTVNKESLMRAVQVRLLSEMGETWDTQFGKLKAFHDEFGHCNVPRSDPQLGIWVNKQREALKINAISVERRALLDELGFSLDVFAQAWNRKFAELKAHFLLNGDRNVQSHTELGIWVSKQRAIYKAGKLSADRQAQLKTIEFNFDPTAARKNNSSVNKDSAKSAHSDADGFFETLSSVKYALAKADGDYCKLDLPTLRWLETQCTLFSNSLLDKDRATALFEIGFFFSLSRNEKWQIKFLECSDLRSEKGSIERNSDAHRWLKEQRRLYAAGKIQTDRLEKLVQSGLIS